MRFAPRRHTLAAALALTSVLALATGCNDDDSGQGAPDGSASPDETQDAAPDAPPLEPLPEEIPANLRPYYEQELEWSACGPPGFECAELTVPMDYENPDDGQDIQLAVTRRPADDGGERIGSILLNPGGPGASAVEFAQGTYEYLFPPEVLSAYDVVGFDARGTGDSEAVECLTGPEMDEHTQTDRTPDDEDEVEALAAALEEFGEACQENTGELLEHISTIESARDMDVLRAALGDEQLQYYGASYGTKLGAVYAGLFPHRAGRLVLDAAMDPRLPTVDTDRQQAGGFETAFRSFAEDCVTRSDCPLGTQDADAASQALQDFYAQVDAEPLPTGEPDRPLTESLAATGVAQALYAEFLWPDLRSALSAAIEDGDGSGLLALADSYNEREPDGTYGTIMNSFPAISCLDSPAAASSPDEVRELLDSYVEASPTFGVDFAWATLQCGLWPVEPTGQPVSIAAEGANDILVIGTTRDPATPYAWAEGLADQLSSGVLLTYEGDGHGAYAMGSTCIDEAVNTYLLEGTSPEDGLVCH
jgi:pimeloyl-ACP methyl ester carboxylesterase